MRLLLALCLTVATPLVAQQPIGRTSATEVQVSGAVDISHGETVLGNGSQITAGNQAVNITLQRGGSLRLCSTTTVHLSKDRSVDDPASSALMMALDRGAIEANYAVGKYSDVLLTPDLRILISGPGQADLSIRVNTKGDTCVDNHGATAPYVTVTSQLEGGAYRVLPDQRVSFQHGSLGEVVDHEPELCGCPVMPVTSVAIAKTPAGLPVGGPSSTPADTAFPIAESEGLSAPPKPSPVPVVPPGQPHAQVNVPLTYNGETPPPPTPPSADTATAPATTTAAATAGVTTASATTAPANPPPAETAPAQVAPQPTSSAQQSTSSGGVFHRIGRFFSRIFGG
jgi:hypothetical protein